MTLTKLHGETVDQTTKIDLFFILIDSYLMGKDLFDEKTPKVIL